MRMDAATILIGMGYVLDRDFIAIADSATDLRLVWRSAQPQPTEAEIDAAALGVYKTNAVNKNRSECSRRLYAKWPAGVQSSASLGVYPQVTVDQLRSDVAAMIAAENTAADLIEAATTVAQVEAVTVAWPVI